MANALGTRYDIDGLVNGRTALHELVLRKDLRGVEWLISHGADVNARDIDRNTPLHFAVQKKTIEIVQCLITNDAYMKAINKKCEKIRHALGSAEPNTIEAKILDILVRVRTSV